MTTEFLTGILFFGHERVENSLIAWQRFNALLYTAEFKTSPKFKAFPDFKLNMTQKWKLYFAKDRKNCGKRRKCWLPPFSPFLTMFSQALFLRMITMCYHVVKG